MPPVQRPVSVCFVDELSVSGIRGWGYAEGSAQPLRLHVIVDQQEIAQVVCNVPLDALPPGLDHPHANIGFSITLPSKYIDGQRHVVELRDVWRRAVEIRTMSGVLEQLVVQETFPLRMHSHVDGVRNGGFEGWMLRNSSDNNALQGDGMIRVTCDEITIGHTRANNHRGDVAKALSAPSNCGFRFVPPMAYLKPYEQTFRFFMMPENRELDESPYRTSFVSDREQARILTLVDAVDKLYGQVTAIRRQLNMIVPKQRYTIANYDDWFRRYVHGLEERVAAERAADAAAPLVSVICPVYRPRLPDFRAAVQSVLDQSYTNWELVIVNDGSKDPALAAVIAEFAAADARIKVISRAKNQGIGAATNVALAAAKGEWVAFFDHDDLLVSVALEMMVEAGGRTGAEMLYSDEDKIGENGLYSDPALKPDWNHRLMLGVNYVCHLLFVRRSRLEEVGPVDRALDGAQDHDLILRLSERIPRHLIHHVPEVLYHWRMTPQSTASSISNKGYAVKAGIGAVAGHLKRLGRPAEVSAIDGITVYKVNWTMTKSPKVAIIIPFKDEIDTTLTCIRALQSGTKYKNFEIVLVDNWSTSAEYSRLVDEITPMKNVRLLRLEEEFNYSRLNNAAVETVKAEYLVFMNNDVFVTDPNWLRAAVNEMLADPEVGIVGGRFYYPNGVVQHAGVVLGIGGVAGHVHVGVPRGEYGYAGRMLFAQEMSAVTAAGMLVRADVFRKVGGFDEVGLRVAFNDIDLCLKVTSAGYRVVWTPDFEADHHESLSRGNDERPVQEARFFQEEQLMKERWGKALENDPYYNKHFTLDRQPYFDLRDPDDQG